MCIYIYIERERERLIYTYTYIYIYNRTASGSCSGRRSRRCAGREAVDEEGAVAKQYNEEIHNIYNVDKSKTFNTKNNIFVFSASGPSWDMMYLPRAVVSAGSLRRDVRGEELRDARLLDGPAHGLHDLGEALAHLAGDLVALGLVALDEVASLPEGVARLAEGLRLQVRAWAR